MPLVSEGIRFGMALTNLLDMTVTLSAVAICADVGRGVRHSLIADFTPAAWIIAGWVGSWLW